MEITKAAVLGAGTMGPGIAYSLAQCGIETALYTRSERTLSIARQRIAQILTVRVSRGMLTQEQADAVGARVTFTNSLEEVLSGVQLLVETIVENVDAKRELFAKADALVAPGTIFASNTSTLNVFELVPECRRPETVIMHGFMPPDIVPLVEIVRGPETTDETVDAAYALVERMGKTPLVVEKYVFGFVVNRLQAVLGAEAMWLVDNGYATPEQIDLAVKKSFMPRSAVLGHFQNRDFSGIDVAVDLDDPDVSETIKDLVRSGRVGVKAGKGFFDYTGRTLDELNIARDNRLLDIFEACEPYVDPI